MADCVLLVADGTMQWVVRGLLERRDFYDLFGVARFRFDILVDREGNDPGVFARGAELLKPYSFTHGYALVVLDARWEGAPKPGKIRQKLRRKLAQTWREGAFEVVVLDPELEAWFWQDDASVARVIGRRPPLRDWMEGAGWWPAESAKPSKPKDALAWALRQTGVRWSSALHGEVARIAPLEGCQDASFRLFVETLATWFPGEGTGAAGDLERPRPGTPS